MIGRELSIDARSKRLTNEAQIGESPHLADSIRLYFFRERERQDDEAGVRTRAATSSVAMLSATSGQPLSTDRDNVVGPMILRLTPPTQPPPPPQPPLHRVP